MSDPQRAAAYLDEIARLTAENEKLMEVVTAHEHVIREQAENNETLTARVKELEEALAARKGLHEGAVLAMEARVKALEGALSGVLWMAEEWFEHGGDETTLADDYEKQLEAARAALTPQQGGE